MITKTEDYLNRELLVHFVLPVLGDTVLHMLRYVPDLEVAFLSLIGHAVFCLCALVVPFGSCDVLAPAAKLALGFIVYGGVMSFPPPSPPFVFALVWGAFAFCLLCGSSLSRQVIKDAKGSKHSDVYAYGILLWELATRDQVLGGSLILWTRCVLFVVLRNIILVLPSSIYGCFFCGCYVYTVIYIPVYVFFHVCWLVAVGGGR